MTHLIKYTGPTQHTRTISVAEAKAGGFILADDLEWGLSNRHTLLLDDLDDSAVEYFESDSDFSVREVGSDAEAPKLTKKQQADLKVAQETQGAGGGGSSIGTGGGGGGVSRTTTSTSTATT